MNKRFFKVGTLLLSAILIVLIPSCKDDELTLPDNVITFETTAVGLSDDASQVEIRLTASRAVSTATVLNITFETAGVEYGRDFVTEPAAVDNTLTLTIPANATATSFTVTREEGVVLDGTESIVFKLAATQADLVVGATSEIKLSFSSIISQGSQLQLNGLTGTETATGAQVGSDAANSVFVDLSSNQQVTVVRRSWDLGLYSGSAFRVKLNNTIGASAVRIDKTNLNDVTAADVDGVSLAVGQGQGTLSLIDGISGSISETLIAEISATESENKVYVINRVGGSGATQPVADFIKVRFLRNGSGYTVQYAKINETSFSTAQVTKDDVSNFKYFSFDNGAVSAEPAKANWDIEWTWSMYFTGPYPYGFSDFVFVNHLGGVKAAQIATATVTYDAYNEANIATTTFVDGRNTIGSSWRATTGTIGVYTDRFYVIQDPAGNVYKLKFVNFHANDGGTRGRPTIEYALVKQGS